VYGTNPFKPTFGVSPPVLAGRYEILEEFATALAEGPGALERACLFIGPRGTGKTVMLNEVEAIARQRGWHVVADTATPGLLARLEEQRLPELLRQLDPDATTWRLKGVSGFGIGAEWETTERHARPPDLRAQLRLLSELIPASGGAGLLLTVDEIHGAERGELRQIGATIQHCFREQLPVAFVAAGLPAAVNDMLANDKVLTFLRRGARYELGDVDLVEAAHALEAPISDAGRTITADALDVAARASAGYPFMIQMIGAQLWRHAGDADTITVDTAHRAVRTAMPRMGRLIHEPALADLSDGDRAFLAAMAIDDGPSRMRDIAERLGVDANYAGQYRLRLIGVEIVEEAGRGRVTFGLPYLREYLRTDGFTRAPAGASSSPRLDSGRSATVPRIDVDGELEP
jgi:hypothetical protein